MILQQGNASSVLINGLPYPKIKLFVNFVSNTQITIEVVNVAYIDGFYPAAKYSDIINGDTGVAFVSMQALIDWIFANMYLNGSSGTSGGGFGNSTFTIGSGGGQKPAGNTLQDAVFVGKTIGDIMVLNNIALQWAIAGVPISGVGVTFNSGTGTFDFTGYGGLVSGTIITIYSK